MTNAAAIIASVEAVLDANSINRESISDFVSDNDYGDIAIVKIGSSTHEFRAHQTVYTVNILLVNTGTGAIAVRDQWINQLLTGLYDAPLTDTVEVTYEHSNDGKKERLETLLTFQTLECV